MKRLAGRGRSLGETVIVEPQWLHEKCNAPRHRGRTEDTGTLRLPWRQVRVHSVWPEDDNCLHLLYIKLSQGRSRLSGTHGRPRRIGHAAGQDTSAGPETHSSSTTSPASVGSGMLGYPQTS